MRLCVSMRDAFSAFSRGKVDFGRLMVFYQIAAPHFFSVLI